MGKASAPRALPENEATAIARNLRVSPQKLNLVAQLIRGKKVATALADLEFSRKRISLDVRKPEGRELFLKMLPRYDVLVENFRTGTLDRWGLDLATLHAHHPDLIVLQGLDGGAHTLRVDLADAQHQVLDSQTVGFTVPPH